MPYSEVENQWFDSQLDHVQELLWSVPIGEEVLREFLLFTIGVVPSRLFVHSICRVFRERAWRISDRHQGSFKT